MADLVGSNQNTLSRGNLEKMRKEWGRAVENSKKEVFSSNVWAIVGKGCHEKSPRKDNTTENKKVDGKEKLR